MGDNKEKKEKKKMELIVLVSIILCKFIMSEFAYDYILKYRFVNIANNILTLVLVAIVLKKIYSKHVNKFITIVTFSAISVYFLCIVLFSVGFFDNISLIKIMKELTILGAIAAVTSIIYMIQYRKVKKIKEEQVQ